MALGCHKVFAEWVHSTRTNVAHCWVVATLSKQWVSVERSPLQGSGSTGGDRKICNQSEAHRGLVSPETTAPEINVYCPSSMVPLGLGQ